LAVVVAEGLGNRRMAEFSPPIRTRITVKCEVVVSGLDAIMETLALNVAKFRRGCVPATMIVIPAAPIMIIGLMIGRWRTWGRASLGHERGGCHQYKGERWKSESIKFHL
jgi:hypothetical protein